MHVLDQMFGPAGVDDDLLLFPQSSGQPMSPETAVNVVEELAQRTGEKLYDNEGNKLFGKHAWRAAGAVYLTSIGVDVYKTRMMAIWACELITHYARLAPLKAITADFRRAIQQKSNASVSDEAAKMKKVNSDRGEDSF